MRRPTVRKKQQRRRQARNPARHTGTAQQAGRSLPRDSSTRARSLQVLADMRRNPSLTLTQAARNREIDARSVRKQLASAFRKDSSGRVVPRATDRFRQTLQIPSTKPGVTISVPTRNSAERQLVGRWMSAINAAGRGDFSELKKFPRGQVVGGVRLPTGAYEVQLILRALAEEEAPYEGLYRSIARPS